VSQRQIRQDRDTLRAPRLIAEFGGRIKPLIHTAVRKRREIRSNSADRRPHPKQPLGYGKTRG
jgi:hypothetical protein